MQQWALEDPSWVPWAVPSPIRKTDTEGLSKVKKRARAEMHQLIRTVVAGPTMTVLGGPIVSSAVAR